MYGRWQRVRPLQGLINHMKKDKGTSLKEWSSWKMTEHEVTTARIFLIVGFLLGNILGALLTILVYLIKTI